MDLRAKVERYLESCNPTPSDDSKRLMVEELKAVGDEGKLELQRILWDFAAHTKGQISTEAVWLWLDAGLEVEDFLLNEAVEGFKREVCPGATFWLATVLGGVNTEACVRLLTETAEALINTSEPTACFNALHCINSCAQLMPDSAHDDLKRLVERAVATVKVPTVIGSRCLHRVSLKWGQLSAGLLGSNAGKDACDIHLQKSACKKATRHHLSARESRGLSFEETVKGDILQGKPAKFVEREHLGPDLGGVLEGYAKAHDEVYMWEPRVLLSNFSLAGSIAEEADRVGLSGFLKEYPLIMGNLKIDALHVRKVDGVPHLRVIEIKSATSVRKHAVVQLAVYGEVLRGRLPGWVVTEAVLFKGRAGQEIVDVHCESSLAFLEGRLRALGLGSPAPELDMFKCRNCEFLPQCRQPIDVEDLEPQTQAALLDSLSPIGALKRPEKSTPSKVPMSPQKSTSSSTPKKSTSSSAPMFPQKSTPTKVPMFPQNSTSGSTLMSPQKSTSSSTPKKSTSSSAPMFPQKSTPTKVPMFPQNSTSSSTPMFPHKSTSSSAQMLPQTDTLSNLPPDVRIFVVSWGFSAALIDSGSGLEYRALRNADDFMSLDITTGETAQVFVQAKGDLQYNIFENQPHADLTEGAECLNTESLSEEDCSLLTSLRDRSQLTPKRLLAKYTPTLVVLFAILRDMYSFEAIGFASDDDLTSMLWGWRRTPNAPRFGQVSEGRPTLDGIWHRRGETRTFTGLKVSDLPGTQDTWCILDSGDNEVGTVTASGVAVLHTEVPDSFAAAGWREEASLEERRTLCTLLRMQELYTALMESTSIQRTGVARMFPVGALTPDGLDPDKLDTFCEVYRAHQQSYLANAKARKWWHSAKLFPCLVEEANRLVDVLDAPHAAHLWAAECPRPTPLPGLEMLTENQKQAVEISAARRLSVVCGPPGTGKTMLLMMIAKDVARGGGRALFVSMRALPEERGTGGNLCIRSFQDLLEGPQDPREKHSFDTVVADEASMIPLPMLGLVLSLLKPDGSLVVSGDPLQLEAQGRDVENLLMRVLRLADGSRLGSKYDVDSALDASYITKLTTCFRSHPDIRRITEWAYLGQQCTRQSSTPPGPTHVLRAPGVASFGGTFYHPMHYKNYKDYNWRAAQYIQQVVNYLDRFGVSPSGGKVSVGVCGHFCKGLHLENLVLGGVDLAQGTPQDRQGTEVDVSILYITYNDRANLRFVNSVDEMYMGLTRGRCVQLVIAPQGYSPVVESIDIDSQRRGFALLSRYIANSVPMPF
eukprot:TRINITY_DN1539_c0_g1_i1.p1 TRINITY_DN1539_c0_g1~~TRINITY_DN1539_c0_g1_i1.p1  ORF type:complete len:1272 (+),score=317.87 TRINITY_DN1539_c0_g1_i1:68-3883(+)